MISTYPTVSPGDILDCGHPCPERTEHYVGYGHWDDKTACYLCMDDRSRAEMTTADTYLAYLAETSPRYDGAHIWAGVLATWTGGHLATVTELWWSKNTWAGKLYHFRAVDATGAHWYGTSPGPGMYARMHRNKSKKGAKS